MAGDWGPQALALAPGPVPVRALVGTQARAQQGRVQQGRAQGQQGQAQEQQGQDSGSP